MTRSSKRVAVAAGIAVAVVAAFLVLTTVVGQAHKVSDRIVTWTGDDSFTPDGAVSSDRGGPSIRADGVMAPGEDYVLMSATTSVKKRNKIVGWKLHHSFKLTAGVGPGSHSPETLKGTETHGCGRYTSTTRGVNIFGATVVQGTLAIHACYEGTNYAGKVANLSHVDVTTYGDAADWSLFDYDGVTDMVKGGGVNRKFKPLMWEYVYRRAYFKWSRGLSSITQTVHSWASLTVRGLGTYEADHQTG